MCLGPEIALAAEAAAPALIGPATGAIVPAATEAAAAFAVPAVEGVLAETALPALAESALPGVTEAALPTIADGGISGAVESISDPFAQSLQSSLNSGQIADPGLMNGMDAQALNPQHAMAGAQQAGIGDSITNTLSRMGDETIKSLTDPKTLAGAGLNAAGSLWQQAALDAEQERLNKEHQKTMDQIAAEGEKMSSDLTGWGERYLSASGDAARQAEEEEKSLTSMQRLMASGEKSNVTPVGKMPGDYTTDRANQMATALTGAADYARRMSKLVAPSLVSDAAQRDLASIGASNSSNLSRMQGLGAIGRATQQNADPSASGMIGGALLQGAGNLVARK